MIRIAKQRIKAGLPAALPESNTADGGTTASVSSRQSPLSRDTQASNPAAHQKQRTASSASPYPKIRAKYDLLIENVISSTKLSPMEKKARIKNLELRYESEIREKTYQQYTIWLFTGFVVIAISVWYAQIYMV